MNKHVRRFIKHLNKTWKNKVVAMMLITTGVISVPVLDNDGTVLLFTIMLGILLLTEKENCILNWRD